LTALTVMAAFTSSHLFQNRIFGTSCTDFLWSRCPT